MFASLNPRDRRLLLACLVIVALAAGVVAILAPQEDDDNVVPSSFSSGTHGAEAAYLTLERSGYRVERSEGPLSELAQQSDAHTVVILADPTPTRTTMAAARSSVAAILQHGGRVIATGLSGGALLPQSQVEELPQIPSGPESACTADPDGFGDLSNSGAVHLREVDFWKQALPEQRVDYTCGRDAVVVSYAVGPGRAIWWADSLPLENAFIAKDGDLTLLLNSLGGTGNRIVWDESLHNDEPGIWSYTHGTPVRLLWLQLALAALLLIVSFSRRSGPLLPDPVVARDAPLEFVYSLGALYDRAGATNTAVQIAYARFCLMLGLKRKRSSADQTREMLAVASSRLGREEPELRPVMEMCEEATYAPAQMLPRQALELVQSLNKFQKEVRQGTLGRNKEQ